MFTFGEALIKLVFVCDFRTIFNDGVFVIGGCVFIVL